MITNTSKKTALARRIRLCRGGWQKATGLMFRPRLRDEGLVFPFKQRTRISLHMLFVFQAIDVAILGDSYEVIELKENLRPWHLYRSEKMSNLVLELPAGTLKKSGTAVGDILRLS